MIRAALLRVIVLPGALLALHFQRDLAGQQTPSADSDPQLLIQLREQVRRAATLRVYTATNAVVMRQPILNDSAIVGAGTELALHDLTKVQRRGSAWSNGLLIGGVTGAIGGGIGGGIAASNFCDGGCNNQGAGAVLGAVAGAAAGGLVGAVVGSQFHRWHTVYDRANTGRPARPRRSHE